MLKHVMPDVPELETGIINWSSFGLIYCKASVYRKT